MIINYIGDLGVGQSVGYAQAGWGYLRSLFEVGVRGFNYSHISIPPPNQPAFGIDWANAPSWAICLKKNMRYGLNEAADVTICHHTPVNIADKDMVRRIRDRVIENSSSILIALTTVETTRFPAWIAKEITRLYDAVIVPTDYNRDPLFALSYSVPHALDSSWAMKREGAGNPDRIVFLYTGAWNYRKNPEGLIRAWFRAFPFPHEKKRLLIKTMTYSNIDLFIKQIYEEEILDSWDWDNSSHESPPKWEDRHDVGVINQVISENQLQNLYRGSDYFITMTRGEGFGLGVAQAIKSGLTAIYPYHSALVFLNNLATKAVEDAGETHHADDVSRVKKLYSEIAPCPNMSPHAHFWGQDLFWWEPDSYQFTGVLLSASKIGLFKNDIPHWRSSYLSYQSVGERLLEVFKSVSFKTHEDTFTS